MSIRSRLLTWLYQFPKRVITDECAPELGPLMVRFFLSPRSWPVALYVHQFRRSDNDRHFHDHPWNFLTLILEGGYIEHTPAGNFQRHPGNILWRPAEWQHWVEIPQGKQSWSLVLRFRRRRVWGFHTEQGFVAWDAYDCG